MEQQDNDKRIVYCIPERQSTSNMEQGFLKPVFEETIDGLVPVDLDVYVKNGLIHVTKGYNKFENSQDGQFFKVEVSVSRSWNENDSHDGISKYVTYDKLAELSKYLDVCILLDAEYPNPNKLEGMTCEATNLPADGFFIRCTDPEGKQVIIGPLDVLRDSIRQEEGIYFFKYKAPDRPFGGVWGRINNAPHSALVFDCDLIPNGVLFSVSNSISYLVNCNSLPCSSAYQLDLSTDENIIKWASKLLKSIDSDVSIQLPKLRNVVEQLPTDSNLPIDIFESRKKRLQKLPDRLSQMEGFNQILADYLRATEGQKIIERYVYTNRDGLLEKYFDEELDKTLEKARESAKKEIAEKEQRIRSLASEIEGLENKQEELKSSQLGHELEEERQEIDSLRKEKQVIYDVATLQAQKKILSDEIEQLKNQKQDADSLLKKAQTRFNNDQDENKLKLIELKMGLDAIAGNVKTTTDLKASILQATSFKNIGGKGDDARLDVVKTLTNNLEKRGRIVTQDDIAVLLTCTIQSLIVTLAGKPGSGKSSTVSELAHILGIKEGRKYAHVQVQRGWSSDRDLLGFYNKLSRCYEPDRFGLYKLLNGLQEIPSEHQFSIVLLDEANLSPIEHYWTDFMGACDDINTFSVSGTKSGQSLKLPKALRFIATVNYDRTTEPLSARFLDRSPVIYLESTTNSLLDNEYVDSQVIDQETTYYSFDELEILFGRKTSSVNFKPDEGRIMNEILQEHRFLDIQFRKRSAISNFTETLRYVLSEDNSEMLKAFDYALLIYVLPLISGQGREYAKAIKNFHEYISSQGLTRSSDRLKNIISNSQFDAYSYFS